MARIKFDQEKERFYETGCKNGVLYKDTVSTNYGKAIGWNGLTGFDDTPEGAEANDMYADDIKYLSIRSAETYKFSIKAYSAPEEFGDCDGTKEVAPGVYLGQQSRSRFGFSVITTVGNDEKGNDYGEKLHLIWNATASPSQRSYATINESPEAMELSWECTTNPVTNSYGKPAASLTINKTSVTEEKWNAFLDILYGTDAADGHEATEGHLPTIDQVVAFFATTNEEEEEEEEEPGETDVVTGN